LSKIERNNNPNAGPLLNFDFMKKMKTIKIFILFFPLVSYAQGNYSFGEKEFTLKNEESSKFTRYTKENFKLKDSVVDLEYLMPPAGDQGDKGSCWAWATTYAIRSVLDNQSTYLLSNSNLNQNNVYSPEYVYQYYKGNQNNCNWGAYSYEMLGKILADGSVKFIDFKYNENACNNQPSKSLKLKAKQYSKTDYTVELINDLYSIQKILAQKQPLVISIRIDDYFSEKGNITVQNPFWTEYHTRKNNHAMVIVGYDNKIKALKVLNSWGKEFGKNGYVWISYSIINSAMNYACYPKKDLSKSIVSVKVKNIEPKKESEVWPNTSNILKSWFKKGYYVIFENFRIGFAGLDNSKKVALVEIKNDSGTLKTKFYIEEKTSKEFYIDGKKYNFTFNNFGPAGLNPFKNGLYFTVENISTSIKIK
jgi:cathepsin K